MRKAGNRERTLFRHLTHPETGGRRGLFFTCQCKQFYNPFLTRPVRAGNLNFLTAPVFLFVQRIKSPFFLASLLCPAAGIGMTFFTFLLSIFCRRNIKKPLNKLLSDFHCPEMFLFITNSALLILKA